MATATDVRSRCGLPHLYSSPEPVIKLREISECDAGRSFRPQPFLQVLGVWQADPTLSIPGEAVSLIPGASHVIISTVMAAL